MKDTIDEVLLSDFSSFQNSILEMPTGKMINLNHGKKQNDSNDQSPKTYKVTEARDNE